MKHRLTPTLLLALFVGPASAQQIVVANRASASVSVIDAHTATAQTVALPPATSTPEPMYVVQVGDEFVVGDRANDRVVRFDKNTLATVGEVSCGDGVFHMWADGSQLWVNNDVDNTTTVIDTTSWQVAATIPVPPALVAQGYKPHDVFVGGGRAWISLLGGSGLDDWVLQYDSATFEPLRRRAVGKDPHLWRDGNTLYVASQNTSEVLALDAESLKEKDQLTVPGAHGIYMPRGSNTLLVTDITSTGVDALYAIRLAGNGTFLSMGAVDTPAGASHNIAATMFGDRVFVTHSGGSSTLVSIYELRPGFQPVGSVTVGANPFGLALVE